MRTTVDPGVIAKPHGRTGRGLKPAFYHVVF
jgi:hypothetical protein